MKKYFSILFILISIHTFCQEFAPVGAEWYYNEQYAFSGDINYIKFHSEKDTIINGKTCKKITKRHKITCYNRPDVEFLYTSNDTVYFLDPNFSQFQILYVLNANPGDSWAIKTKNENQEIDSLKIFVDSVTILQINERHLKALYVTYNNANVPNAYTSTIIEKIGDIKYMFNWHPWYSIACDDNYTSGLRCYQDSDIGLYSTGIVDSCDYIYNWTGIEDKEAITQIELFPNPAQNYIEIKATHISNYSIDFIGLNGKVLISDKTCNSKLNLDLSKIETGIYVILLRHHNQIVGYKKVIKE